MCDNVTTHTPVSVSQECSLHQPIEDDIAMWRDLGIDVVGLISPKLEPIGWDAGLVADAGLQVSSIGVDMAGLERAVEYAAVRRRRFGVDMHRATRGTLLGRSY